MFVMMIPRVWFRLALVFFSMAIMLALISIVLNTGLQYTSYQGLFNTLAMAITGCALLSVSFSMVGIFMEKIRRCRYYLLIAVNLLFIIWMIIE
jgi:hypothetical protein